VAVNKIDQVESEAVERTIRSAGALNSRARILAISAEQRTHLGALMDEVR
jgi:G3E family GTPase